MTDELTFLRSLEQKLQQLRELIAPHYDYRETLELRKLINHRIIELLEAEQMKERE